MDVNLNETEAYQLPKKAKHDCEAERSKRLERVEEPKKESEDAASTQSHNSQVATASDR